MITHVTVNYGNGQRIPARTKSPRLSGLRRIKFDKHHHRQEPCYTRAVVGWVVRRLVCASIWMKASGRGWRDLHETRAKTIKSIPCCGGRACPLYTPSLVCPAPSVDA